MGRIQLPANISNIESGTASPEESRQTGSAVSSELRACQQASGKNLRPLGGQFNDALARRDVLPKQLTPLSARPGKAEAGTFYSHDGQHYILDRYQSQARVYEVYSDNAWATVRVRDPRRPHGQGTSVRYHNGHWRADEGGLPGGGKKQRKVNVADAARSAIFQSPTHATYEMPAESRSIVVRLIADRRYSLNHIYRGGSKEEEAVQEQFFDAQFRLQSDALSRVSRKLPPRPPQPEIPPQTILTDFLQIIYAHTSGVVIGEAHHSIASKKLIIDNMLWLAQHNVKTLYMEHLLSDVHQEDLDSFNKSGRMSKPLCDYLKNQDEGHMTDPAGNYNFTMVVIVAQKNGIEVRAIDCVASYILRGLPGKHPTSRQQMFNHYATEVIQSHQAVTGYHKWIALMGNSHSNTYRNEPGIAEMNEGIGVRVTDVQPGMARSVAYDAGEHVREDQLPHNMVLLKGDYLVQLPTLRENPLEPVQSALSIEQKLVLPGQFLIQQGQNGEQVIVHRSRQGAICLTQVKFDAQDGCYVSRASWKTVDGKRYADINALIEALKANGMTQIQ